VAELEARIAELEAHVADDDGDVEHDVDEGDEDTVVSTHRSISVIAPAGTKRRTVALTAARVRPRLEDLHLRGIWTFTFRGRGA